VGIELRGARFRGHFLRIVTLILFVLFFVFGQYFTLNIPSDSSQISQAKGESVGQGAWWAGVDLVASCNIDVRVVAIKVL